MGAAIEALQRIGVKLFAADGSSVQPREFVPIFHRWIQTQAVANHLLIDVADYAHVPDGPGVLLVAHEGNFSLDLGGGRLGLAFNRKIPASGGIVERWRSITRTALEACQRLEDEPSLQGRLRFRGDEIDLFANDRLQAPNSDATRTALEAQLAELVRSLYGEVPCTVTPEHDARERFSVRLRAAQPLTARDLLARLR
jgi:hypothetical protein